MLEESIKFNVPYHQDLKKLHFILLKKSSTDKISSVTSASCAEAIRPSTLQRLCPLPSMGCPDGDTLGGLGARAANLMLLQGEARQAAGMEEECSARPCATDFSIAAIMARDRQERRERRRHRDPREDTLTPLGLYFVSKFLILYYWARED